MSNADKVKVLFISPYPPQTGGVASFTWNLVQALKNSGDVVPRVMAVGADTVAYGKDVVAQFRQDSRYAHLSAAEMCNRAGADIVMVEHGDGVFGGKNGEYLLDLLERMKTPYLVTCHSVGPDLHESQRDILSEICYFSEGAIVMSEQDKQALAGGCEVGEDKIHVLPYGVPEPLRQDRPVLKAKEGLFGSTVITSVGELSPNSGFEYAIQAIALLARTYPDIKYLIVETPNSRQDWKLRENYRRALEVLVDDLGLADNVYFIGKPATVEQAMQYVAMADVCVTPDLVCNTPTDSALAFAVGCGRAVVSTPYPYAQELLTGGRGLLSNFADPESLAQCIDLVLESPGAKNRMEANVKDLGKKMAMPNVTRQYQQLLQTAAQQSQEDVVS